VVRAQVGCGHFPCLYACYRLSLAARVVDKTPRTAVGKAATSRNFCSPSETTLSIRPSPPVTLAPLPFPSSGRPYETIARDRRKTRDARLKRNTEDGERSRRGIHRHREHRA